MSKYPIRVKSTVYDKPGRYTVDWLCRNGPAHVRDKWINLITFGHTVYLPTVCAHPSWHNYPSTSERQCTACKLVEPYNDNDWMI